MAESTETNVINTEDNQVKEVSNPFDGASKKEDVVTEEKKVEDVVKEVKPTEEKKPEIAAAAKPKEEAKPKEVANEEKVFANETSERIFNLLKEGKEDEVYNFLDKKKAITSLDKMSAEQKIKLHLKNINSDFSDSEINDLFEEKFNAPEKPEQEVDELDDDFAAREAKYQDKLAKYNRKLERESKVASADLRKQVEELVLPDITKTNSTSNNEQTQEELDAIAEKREVYLNSIDNGLTDFQSIDAIFKDKDVEIPVAYKISDKEKQELKATMSDFNLEKFIQERWITEDGKFNTKQQAEDIFMLTHGKEAINDLITKIGTKRYADAIKGQKNVNYSGVSKSGNLEPSVQEAMDKAAAHFFSN